ncbi:MAG: hypothetical protein EBW05_05955 [Betaproteobacteria bacterium]|nr:hypothetical protein [Betaproteobacteria bacterium]
MPKKAFAKAASLRSMRSCRFIHNRQLRMDLNDAAFAKAFFGIWLDPRTTEPALRKSLIGEA